MTLAATGRFALAVSGFVAVLAAVAAVALILLVLSSPDQIVLATDDGELSSFLAFLLDRIVDVARAWIRALS